MGRKRTGPSCAWSSGSKGRQVCNGLEEQVDMRGVLGTDVVDTKRNRLRAAREEMLVHSHQQTNATRELETKDLSVNIKLASGLFFLTSIASVTVTRELCLEIDRQSGLRPDA